jgi:hypothetical protein
MSGSFYTLNSKYNTLLSLFNSFFPYPPSPYPAPGDVMTLSTAQTATGLKTFSVLPQSSVVPLANNDLVNKLYVDGSVGATPDIDAVLGQGDIATGKQMLLNDAVGTNFSLYTPSEIQVSDGVTDTVFFQPTQLQYTDNTGTVSATWADIISGSASSNTLQEVLTAGNTANIGFQLDAGAGANTQTPTQIVLDGQGTGGANFLQSNTGTKDSVIVKNQDLTTSPNPDTTSATLSNKQLALFNQVPFGYTKTLDLTQDTSTGLFHTDTQPFPLPLKIETTQSLRLKATDTGGSNYGIYIDPATPNIYYPYGNPAVDRLVISSGNIETIDVTNQQALSILPSTIIFQNIGGSRSNDITATSVVFKDTTNPSNVNGSYGLTGIVLNDLAGLTPVSTNVNTSAITINNNNQGYSQMTPGVATIQKVSAGGQANPCLLLNNTNATGSVALEVYKAKPTAGTAGDVLFNQSVYGKDSANAKQEYTRISHTIRDPTNGAEDGSIEIGAFVNGAYTNFIQLNANDAPIGEVNVFRPIDFIGGSDANNTIKLSGVGSNDLNLTGASSAGTGHINLTSKTGTVLNVAGNMNINASASTGAGNINMTVKSGANLIMTNLPTSNPGVAGALWNNGGVLNIA